MIIHTGVWNENQKSINSRLVKCFMLLFFFLFKKRNLPIWIELCRTEVIEEHRGGTKRDRKVKSYLQRNKMCE